MKRILITFLVCFISNSVFSQEEEGNTKIRKHAIGIGAGTGFNADYSIRLNKSFALTAKYASLDYAHEDYEYELDGQNFLIDGALDFTHADLLLNIGGSLRLVVGAGYFMSNELDLGLAFTESIHIKDVEFTPGEGAGNISINSKWDQILPYVGVGFGRVIPKTGFNIALEIGAFYDQNGPDISLDATGIIEPTQNQEEILQEGFAENKFLPNLNLRLAFSF